MYDTLCIMVRLLSLVIIGYYSKNDACKKSTKVYLFKHTQTFTVYLSLFLNRYEQ